MDAILLLGLTSSFLGSVWALFERDNPTYCIVTLSRTQRDLINIATGVILFGGYVLILVSHGPWFRNAVIVVMWYVVGCRIIAPFFYRQIASRMAQWLD